MKLRATILLLLSLPISQQMILKPGSPAPRDLFLMFDSTAQKQRIRDREEFRQQLNDSMNQWLTSTNNKLEYQRIESESFRDLERMYGKTKQQINRIRDNTMEGLTQLLSLS